MTQSRSWPGVRMAVPQCVFVAARFSLCLWLFRYFKMVRRLKPATARLAMKYDAASRAEYDKKIFSRWFVNRCIGV
jgi:hypothetical protein